MWATEDKQDSDWEDDDSMDSAKEVVDVDKVGQNKARKLRTLWPCPCCRYFLPGLVYFGCSGWLGCCGNRAWFRNGNTICLIR